jgi:serine protease AprX
MSQLNERGARTERSSALWGTGGRGGDRSSVLWGKGGRGFLVACVAALVLVAPMASMADSGKGKAPVADNFIAPTLLNAHGPVDVIVQSSGGLADATAKLTGLGVFQKDVKQLGLIGAVEATVPAEQLKKLKGVPGITVTPDATVQVSGSTTPVSSSQLWPYEAGNASLWSADLTTYVGKAPAIAIVDSGVQQRSDFGTRIIASVNLSTLPGNTSLNDERGHGTFVAGIAAGAAPDLAGASPGAPIVSVKVMDANGQAKTSDIITACQWILDHKGQYNIRVANFSLHSSYATNFYRDPLDQAVEKLWFNGVVVVAAAGNYGISNTQPSGVKYSPGNDPFVITVGAVDIGDSMRKNDDAAAPFSAWGYTNDGFFKPEVAAPGRYMVGPVPASSTLTQVKASNLVGTDRIQLSGTSFAAPVVAGTVADMLARNPGWTPDQVKGALMRTARAVKSGTPQSAGLGEITATRAVTTPLTPNPNKGLDQFLSGTTFDGNAWATAAKAQGKAWNAMSWADQSWSDMSWADQAWATMSWADQSWSDMSWTDMSWADMSWADVSYEDAAEGDSLSGAAGYTAPLDVAAEAAADPDTAVPVDGVDPATALGVAPATTTSSTTSPSTTTTSSTATPSTTTTTSSTATPSTTTTTSSTTSPSTTTTTSSTTSPSTTTTTSSTTSPSTTTTTSSATSPSTTTTSIVGP